MIDLGKVMPGSTIRIPFGSYAASTGASSATTNYVAGDVQIYKDGGTTQRASSAGITATADFDSLVGINLVSIDLADNTTAGFYAAGSEYVVVVSDVTIDGQTVRFPIARFVIGVDRAVLNTTIATLASQTSFTLTAGPAEDSALIGCTAYIHDVASAVQGSFVYISAYTGSTKTVTLSSGPTYTAAATDNICIFAPTHVYGVSGTTQTARDLGASVLLSSGTGTGQISLSSGAVLLQATQTGVTIPTVTTITNVVSANVTQWLGSAAATPTVAGVPEVDITHVSGVVTTATLDSLSSQISAIGSGTGAALNFAASDDNADGTVSGVTLAQVGTPTGTFSNTSADDASTHVIASADVAGTQTITWAYGFNCGVARSASKVTWKGTMSGTGPAPDTFTFAAWNGSTWDTRLVVANSVTTVQTFDIPLLSTHTTTTGLVIIRITFAEADAGTLTTNLLLVQAQQSGSLVGYSDGAIWYNSNASNTNTVPYIDGVADNPVSSLAAVLSLAVALKIPRVRIANGSTMTLNAAVDNYSLVGQNWSLALGGQSISGSYIEGASITGTGTGASPPEFFNCHFVGAASAPTVPPCTLLKCGINTTETYPFTAGSAGQFLIVDCFSEVEGSGTPYFSFPGACKINIRRWAGGTNVTLNNSAANMTIEVLAGGGQTIALGGADAEIRGICRAVSLTGVTTDSKVQINAVTGPISIAGADGEVNIYGVCGVVTDNRTGTKGGTNSAISLVNVNAEVDTALNTAIPGSPTADSINERIVALDTGVNITKVNNITIDGSGTELDPWGPAA